MDLGEVDVVASGPFVVIESVGETGIDVDSIISVVSLVVNFVDTCIEGCVVGDSCLVVAGVVVDSFEGSVELSKGDVVVLFGDLGVCDGVE